MFLGDFVEQLAASLQRGKVAMPFENEEPWHELFYDLKQADWDGKPPFLQALRFDWDGPYPKCRELSEFLHALHWNACVDARNPHFDEITLPPAIEEAWSRRAEQIEPATMGFLERAATRARELFSNEAQLVP